MAYRQHKKDPVEMHYYDVDYKRNYITGNGYDHTREISKEEFLGKKTDGETGLTLPGQKRSKNPADTGDGHA